MNNNERRLTTGDVMKYCQVSRATVLKWIKSNRLVAYVHPDGQYRITQIAFVDFLKEYNMPMDQTFFREMSDSSQGISKTRA
jgi:two-component system, OmpR family, response regulator VicR